MTTQQGTIPTSFTEAVWEVATDTDYLPEWWSEAYWNAETQRFVVRIDDGLGNVVRKKLTKVQVAEAYLSMPNRTHCGGYDLVADPDSCSADLILQQAVLGEITYG
tara:strand:- start:60 stop:377 length:318 start_codon:yes stop_codon:yes gene_type:complete